MSRTTLSLLIAWNVALTALLAWSLLGGRGDGASRSTAGDDGTTATHTAMHLDTAALSEARIAYFTLDSLRKHTDMLKEARSTFEKEEVRQRGKAEKEARDIERRMRELYGKDHTYSTQAELQADERTMMELNERMRDLAEESETHLMMLGERFKMEFSALLQQVLAEYNAAAGFDYIISVEPGGQVWVGNPGLDITPAIIEAMNRHHKAKKAPVSER